MISKRLITLAVAATLGLATTQTVYAASSPDNTPVSAALKGITTLPGNTPNTSGDSNDTGDSSDTSQNELAQNGTAQGLPPVDTRPAPSGGISNAYRAPTRQTLVVIPGVNQVIPIARGHLNRIMTPFPHPVVHTTSSAKISVQGNVLYVASTESGPTTLYVSPKNDDDVALSLTLVPRSIPPREVHLRLSKNEGEVYSSQARADKWEREQPYVETIKEALRDLALGKVPPGYGMSQWAKGDPMIACAQPQLAIKQGQILTGSSLTLLVGLAKNKSSHRVQIREARCRQDNVLAVAAWPRASLAPGGQTEIYVVVKQPSPDEKAEQRPSLLIK